MVVMVEFYLLSSKILSYLTVTSGSPATATPAAYNSAVLTVASPILPLYFLLKS